jgi:hypothetical protein
VPKDARSVGVVATDFLFESDFRVSTCGGDLTYEAENQNKLTKTSCTFKYSSINSFEYFMKKRLPGNIFTFCSLLRLNKRNQSNAKKYSKSHQISRQRDCYVAHQHERSSLMTCPMLLEERCSPSSELSTDHKVDGEVATHAFQHFRADACLEEARAATIESLIHNQQITTKFNLLMRTMSVATLPGRWCCLLSGPRPFR